MNESEKSLQIPEADVIMLESLIKSPVYGAFKRLVDRYREGSKSILMHGKEMQTIFEARGHIRGLDLLDQLPALVVKDRDDRLQKAEDLKADKAKNAYRSPYPIPIDPVKPEKPKKKKV